MMDIEEVVARTSGTCSALRSGASKNFLPHRSSHPHTTNLSSHPLKMPPKVQSLSAKCKAKVESRAGPPSKKPKGDAVPNTPPDTTTAAKPLNPLTPRKGVMSLSGAPPTEDCKIYINPTARKLFTQVTVCLSHLGFF